MRAASPVAVEGSLSVTVAWDGQCIHDVAIKSTRPVYACRVFHGKSVEQTVATLPLLYSVCRRAQGVAAIEACQQAQGVTSSLSVRRTRKLLVLAEIAQEYLWRFMLDWQQITGGQADAQDYAALRGKLDGALQPILADPGWRRIGNAAIELKSGAWEYFSALLAQYLERNIFGVAPQVWADLASVEALEKWRWNRQTPIAGVIEWLMEQGGEHGRSAVLLMPPAAELAQVADALATDEDFARQPHWRGGPLETGALARMQHHPLVLAVSQQAGNVILARVLARLLELAALPQRMLQVMHAVSFDDGAAASDTGAGQAWVETARGLLLHRVEIAGDVVRRYQILAPTEWNFHPAGALAEEVSGMRATDEQTLRKKIAMTMLALDPCVGYELRITHA